MTMLQGTLYTGEVSLGTPATLRVNADGGYTVDRADGEACDVRGLMRDVAITTRLARIPRLITLGGGAQFESADNDAVDDLLAHHGLSGKTTLIHRLEDSPALAFLFLLLTVIAAIVFVRSGVPYLAERAAYAMPQELSREISMHALQTLERGILMPTEMPPRAQERLQHRVDELVAAEGLEYRPRILLRRSDALGANAFALPGGEIVITDALIGLMSSEDEAMAVIAHEMGHIAHRHGLRQVASRSILGLLIFAATSDFNMIVQSATAFPLLVAVNGYSRVHEAEADAHAVAMMQRNGMDVRHFREILRKLEHERQGANVPGFLKTHPDTEERLRLLGQE